MSKYIFEYIAKEYFSGNIDIQKSIPIKASSKKALMYEFVKIKDENRDQNDFKFYEITIYNCNEINHYVNQFNFFTVNEWLKRRCKGE